MSPTYRGMQAGLVTFAGHNGDEIEGYLARPEDADPVGAVVVLHHMPGWDEGSIEITRKFAHHGYAALCPDLYHREGPGEADEVAAASYLRAQSYANGKVGIIGFCSGGRQVVLCASRLDHLDAAVDCWGGRVIADADQLTEKHPVAPIDLTADLAAPLLGIFGNDDRSPSPEQVDAHEEALKAAGKTYEFRRYDGAGHGFFSVNRPGYRAEQATEAWGEVFTWFGRYLASDAG